MQSFEEETQRLGGLDRRRGCNLRGGFLRATVGNSRGALTGALIWIFQIRAPGAAVLLLDKNITRRPALSPTRNRPFGWADMICEKCDKLRSQIETGAMSQFSIADRRGWRGPLTIRDDELLLAIQRRLRDADHRALETAEREKRHADRARKWAKYDEELEAAE